MFRFFLDSPFVHIVHMLFNSFCSHHHSSRIIFALIGISTGTLAAFVAKIVETIQEYKFKTSLKYLLEQEEENAALVGCLFFVGISIIFGLIATLLVNYIEPVAAGSGIPQLKAYLNGTRGVFLKYQIFISKSRRTILRSCS